LASNDPDRDASSFFDLVLAGVVSRSLYVGSGGVDPDFVWAKLAALADGARIASQRFWPLRPVSGQ
jgi:hypothetical protein